MLPLAPTTFGYFYQVLTSPPAGVDGCASDPARTDGPLPVILHTADIDPDGHLSRTELTRVGEHFSARCDTTWTVAYHVLPTTEDGFAPGR